MNSLRFVTVSVSCVRWRESNWEKRRDKRRRWERERKRGARGWRRKDEDRNNVGHSVSGWVISKATFTKLSFHYILQRFKWRHILVSSHINTHSYDVSVRVNVHVRCPCLCIRIRKDVSVAVYIFFSFHFFLHLQSPFDMRILNEFPFRQHINYKHWNILMCRQRRFSCEFRRGTRLERDSYT